MKVFRVVWAACLTAAYLHAGPVEARWEQKVKAKKGEMDMEYESWSDVASYAEELFEFIGPKGLAQP